jgi:dipeptidyl aminopeptidase/acylaminoacyl peptidase
MSVSTRTIRALHPAVRPGGRPLTAEDLWHIPRVGAPAPAPDGTWAVVPVMTYDLEKNEGKSRLWMVSAIGAFEPRPLTAPDLTSTAPRVSPDGARVAFVRKREKTEKAQLHVLPLDGGEAEKVTDLPLGVIDPRWFPDGRRIAFLAPLIAGHLTIEKTKVRIEERDKDPVKAHVSENRVYRYWDTWLDGGEVPHLFVLDLETRELTDLTPDSARWFELMDPEGQYDISPDGKEIVFSANSSEPPHQRLRWALYTVPVAGGEPTCLTPDRPWEDSRPRYSPDGASIVYGTQKDPDFYADRVRLARYDRKTGTHSVLTEEWDRSAMGWEFDGAGRLVFLAEDRARIVIYALPPQGGTPAAQFEGATVTCLAIAKGRLYFTQQTMSLPAELWTATADGKNAAPLTHFADPVLKDVALGEVQEMEFEGARGDVVQAYLVLPPGFDPAKQHPLVHVIHGGPHGISGDQFHPRWNGHLFAAPGYVVAMVNFHGSTSWGQEYAQCIQALWGEYPMADIEAATDALLATGFVDEKAMAITGGSYGGYLVSWIGAHTDRYACIVNHAGVYNTQAQYASDVTQGRRRSFGGEPWDGLEAIDRWNPARFAAGTRTPTLVVHGENDFRVPVDQGLECYNVLQGKGIPSRLIYFPDENHWVLKPRNSVFWYREVHGWLSRWLQRA